MEAEHVMEATHWQMAFFTVLLVEDVAGPSRQLGRHPQSWLLPAYAAYFRLL